MDFLKKAAESISSSSNNNNQQQQGNNNNNNNASGSTQQPQQQQQTDDYGDKAFAALAAKTGYSLGRDTQEKITDAGRGAFEKASGQKVPEKFSN
ncbi:hypothetical protein VD0002_g1088 [Verticillium dahliae]|uniref:Uncharacterized protein n=1 Tax=Verticillium dahliae TaxID=27337 RepID=A0A2J8F5Z6_VERDA|nr:hypothetical protein VdG2_01706 [Verticillium dahliae VDG2]KAH6690067.1 hypothetical protein EV126DRAFT_430996 [Verticillium dahliae]PNH31028.1 hypothetical protein BJF96_g5761 [Verticillium dahliae]PNH48045.1 hypothetical protein VD0004_g366 [Verticillium dahliae]PNH55311.1 hypothetical protein VD0003_g2300 [Verticillium dahliae]